MKVRRVIYRDYTPQDPSDGFSDCVVSSLKHIDFTDPRPSPEWDYYLLSQVDAGEAGRPICFQVTTQPYYPIYSWQCHRWVMGGNQYLLQLPGDVIVEEIVDTEIEEPLNSGTWNIEGQGGVDIHLNANYPGYYIGGWYASIEITEFDDSQISADFTPNPNRYNFGELTLDYHGYTCQTIPLNRRKLFISYRTWMPSLEPGGDPEELSVWIPTPTWEKATGIKWGLYPTVKGILRVWWMRFLITMDAYF